MSSREIEVENNDFGIKVIPNSSHWCIDLKIDGIADLKKSGITESDPYICITLKSMHVLKPKNLRTKIIMNQPNPEWNR